MGHRGLRVHHHDLNGSDNDSGNNSDTEALRSASWKDRLCKRQLGMARC